MPKLKRFSSRKKFSGNKKKLMRMEIILLLTYYNIQKLIKNDSEIFDEMDYKDNVYRHLDIINAKITCRIQNMNIILIWICNYFLFNFASYRKNMSLKLLKIFPKKSKDYFLIVVQGEWHRKDVRQSVSPPKSQFDICINN